MALLRLEITWHTKWCRLPSPKMVEENKSERRHLYMSQTSFTKLVIDYQNKSLLTASKKYRHYRSSTGFTWHNGAIPADEIWLKLGGDKGHGSFKLTLQTINVTSPNSTKCTTILAVFRAGDSKYNWHTALDQYKEQIREIEGMQWRYRVGNQFPDTTYNRTRLCRN